MRTDPVRMREDVPVVSTESSGRLLRLLSALQARRLWSGPDLADRLGVSTRTVRRDIDRLRSLGYPVEAAPGVVGGYQLGVGGELPPLLLDDDEAAAIVVALGLLAASATGGIEQAALAAVAKLDRLLPARLRARSRALRVATVSLARPNEPVDTDVLVTLAQAIDGNERVAVGYRDREGRSSDRRLDPHRLVSTGRRWYLVAFDVDRDDWRTLRVDRVMSARRTGHRFAPRPMEDPATFVATATGVAPYRYQAVVVFEIPPDDLRARIPPTVGVVEPHDRGSVLTVGSDDLDAMLGHLVGMGLPFEVVEPPELRARVRQAGRAMARAHRD